MLLTDVQPYDSDILHLSISTKTYWWHQLLSNGEKLFVHLIVPHRYVQKSQEGLFGTNNLFELLIFKNLTYGNCNYRRHVICLIHDLKGVFSKFFFRYQDQEDHEHQVTCTSRLPLFRTR